MIDSILELASLALIFSSCSSYFLQFSISFEYLLVTFAKLYDEGPKEGSTNLAMCIVSPPKPET